MTGNLTVGRFNVKSSKKVIFFEDFQHKVSFLNYITLNVATYIDMHD